MTKIAKPVQRKFYPRPLVKDQVVWYATITTSQDHPGDKCLSVIKQVEADYAVEPLTVVSETTTMEHKGTAKFVRELVEARKAQGFVVGFLERERS